MIMLNRCRPLLVLLLLCLSPAAVSALEIARNTVWDGTVLLRESVTVLPGATLLIRPGTVVRLEAASSGDGPLTLLVHGRIIAQGTEKEPILFTSASPAPRPGDWGGILFEKELDRPSRFRYCRVEYARIALGGAAGGVLVEDSQFAHNLVGLAPRKELKGGAFGCEIAGNATGVRYDQNSTFELVGCRVRGNSAEGVACLYNSSPSIKGCTFDRNGNVGVFCLQGSSPLLTDSAIIGSPRGVYAEMRSHPVLEHNDIRENGTGIWAEKLVAPRLFANRITGNDVGIYCNYSGYPVLRGNAVEGNRRFALVLGDNQSVLVDALLPTAARYQVLEGEGPAVPAGQGERKPAAAPQGVSEKIVDARENWWGSAAAAQMGEEGAEKNVAIFEDFHDKPDTEYLGRRYPRDRVVYTGWLTSPPETGPREGLLSGVSGKVVLHGKPLSGARVHVFRDLSEGAAGEGITFSAPTDGEGRFSLHLAPGRYFLVARKTASPFPDAAFEPGDLFGYHGGNPVTVRGGSYEEVNLQVEAAGAWEKQKSSDTEAAIVSGIVAGPAGKVEGTGVYLYPASGELRGPDLFGPGGAVPGGVDASGRFEVEVPPGRYNVVAVKRPDGRLGPLQPGDLFGFFPCNPVTVREGERVTLTLSTTEKIRGPSASPRGDAGPGIAGTIRDGEGRPLSGVYAFASTEPYPGGTMPPHRSRPTGEDGAFFLPLPGKGVYYLGGRSGYGGPPGPGEWSSFQGESSLTRIDFSGEGIRGADLVLGRME